MGRAEEYPYDTFTYIPRHGIFVHRSPGGVRALSARCTHLGCAVLPGDDGFLCPCHGSRFDARGRVIGGAAQRDLPWLRVSRAADGMLVVHMAERVSAETILAG